MSTKITDKQIEQVKALVIPKYTIDPSAKDAIRTILEPLIIAFKDDGIPEAKSFEDLQEFVKELFPSQFGKAVINDALKTYTPTKVYNLGSVKKYNLFASRVVDFALTDLLELAGKLSTVKKEKKITAVDIMTVIRSEPIWNIYYENTARPIIKYLGKKEQRASKRGSKKVSRKRTTKRASKKFSKKVSRKKTSKRSSKKASRKRTAKRSSKKASRKRTSKRSSKKASKKASRKRTAKQSSKKASKKVSRKRASKKSSTKASKKASRKKTSKRSSKKASKKVSRKRTKRSSKRKSKKVSKK